MITHHTTRKLVFVCLCLILCQGLLAQGKPKTAPPKTNELEKLVAGTGLPYKQIDDSLISILYGGQNIESYNVYIQSVADLLIVYTNLSDAITGKIDTTKFGYLLQQNNHFDIIKLASDESNNMYVRADVYRSTVNTPVLTRIIKQVANVTNILGGELK